MNCILEYDEDSSEKNSISSSEKNRISSSVSRNEGISSCLDVNAQYFVPRPNALFFSKVLYSTSGLPIRGHECCRDAALIEAKRLLDAMLQHVPSVAKRLVQAGAEFHVIAEAHACSELPYLKRFRGSIQDGMDWDERNRGTAHRLWASCAEENLLCLESDRYRDHRSICVHEFAHTIMQCGVSAAVRNLIRKRYQEATGEGKWATAYASTNDDEFFAELTMWYFGSRGDFGRIRPKPEAGQAWFAMYDPVSFSLIRDFYTGLLTGCAPTRTLLPALPPVLEFENTHTDCFSSDEESDTEAASSGAEHPSSAEPFEFDAENSLGKRNDDDVEERTKLPVELIVTNLTSHTLKMYWLDHKGQRQPRGEVLKGDNAFYCTYSGDRLLITDTHGQGVAIFIPDRASPLARAVIGRQRRQ